VVAGGSSGRAKGRHRDEPEAGRILPPAPSTIDLHTHTRRSDGILHPADLVTAAAAAGVGLLSITDHDTLAGYREAVSGDGLPAGLELIPGVEINCLVAGREDLWEGEIHVLGLGVDPEDEAFEAVLAAQRGARRERFIRILDRLRELGMPVDREIEAMELGDDDALGRPTVARALMVAGHAESVEDAFRRLLGRGLPAYVARQGLGPVEAIRAIRSAGGLASLAHFGEALERQAVVRELVGVGLGGIEVYHRSFDEVTVAAVGSVAEALMLVPTGGTDYHGDLGPYAESHAALWIPPDVAVKVRGALAIHHVQNR
jgi:3',5'-nucleoside bisphosphate phosphatase